MKRPNRIGGWSRLLAVLTVLLPWESGAGEHKPEQMRPIASFALSV